MATEPKRREPDIPSPKPHIQPERKPEEIPRREDVPEKELPTAMQLYDPLMSANDTMARRDNKVKDQTDVTYTATLPSDYHQVLRQSLTKSLVSYHPPSKEIPPELHELLARLGKTNK